MKLYVVGFGSGSRDVITLTAQKAIISSEIIVGYTLYAELMKKFFPDKPYITTPMRKETDRVKLALEKAAEGHTVSLICSGDSGVYGMAGLAIELSQKYPVVDIEIIPGVTAALSGGAVLGSPLTCDFAVISLSDLLTPWDKIERRLECVAMADFAIAIYNPSSKKRTEHLKKACEILLRYKAENTVCGIVRNIGRNGQESRILTLAELKNTTVDMFTTVFIGTSETKIIGGKMVTPRGYRNV